MESSSEIASIETSDAPGTPLLATKLHVPRRRRNLIARPRLTERLERADPPALTLVSAAAGFGKTTLLTDWLADRSRTAWVSLDERDNDASVFWTYVAAALHAVAPSVGRELQPVMGGPAPPIDAMVATLLNELTAADHDITLVLDDYHAIESREVHDSVTFLVEHLPPGVHMVLASRSDPPLPLASLRARGDLVEIRAADLRFTTDEAAGYLNDTMGLALSSDDISVLEARTEGWVAALQLAGLSLQGRHDSAAFVAAFGGDDRFILDYLAGEVLDRQTDDVRDFLLQTSILSRLTGPLCDAVTGQSDGKSTLEHLDRANLFLVALDDHRTWYRYHHLFADVLRARLLDEQGDRVAGLHRRASDWFAGAGDAPEAIRHAMAADDVERAAELIELAVPSMRQARREATMRDWFQALPAEVFATRPVLSVGYVGALMASGGSEGVEPLLDHVERSLDPSSADDIVYVDPEGFASLPAQAAIYRAALALIAGDPAATITHANRALALITPDDHMRRGSAAALVGLAHWAVGDLESAELRYAEAIDALGRAGHLSDVLGCSLALGDIQVSQGHLDAAMATTDRALQLASAHQVRRGMADMHVALAEVLLERNDLAGAERQLAISQDLGEHAALGQHAYRSRVALGRLYAARGDLDGSLALLHEADRVFDSDFSPPIRPVHAAIARTQIARGDIAAAEAWARHDGVTEHDELTYLQEYEHLTLARVLIARQASDAAAHLLSRLFDAAEAGQRGGSSVEALALLALVHAQRGDRPAALESLDAALDRAEPERLVRVFLDEGPPMVALLRLVEAHGTASAQARRILGHASGSESPAPSGLVEELSPRELDVLRLLRSDLSGPDIASELLVSLNTLRTHTKSIYAKLGVNNRREAVSRAAELGL